MMAVAKQTETNQNCLQNGTQQGGQVNSSSLTAQNCCAGCQMPIKDRFIFSVIEQNFHQDCVRCVDCSSNLNERCYTYEGKLYCRRDYWHRFGPKCSACQEPIKPTELVQRLKENLIYHLSCFVCQDCKRHLQAGEQLHLIDDKRLLCKRDFIAASAAQQQQAATSTSSIPPSALSSSSIVATNNHQATTKAAANSNSNGQQSRNQLAVNKSNTTSTNTNNNSNNNNNQENEANLADNMSSASNTSEQHLSGPLGGLLVGEELADELDLDLDDQSSIADGESGGGATLGNGERSGAGMRFACHYAPQSGTNGSQTKSTEELLKGSSMVDCGDDLVDANGKRRGPRTTIKPKQLETLRQAFDNTPKPSRHVREQLAAQTGLNMRVIQVWFQNRRSKERRMKNSNGSARRNFFRSSSRRLRVGPNAPASNGTNDGGQQQQSLIAGGRNGSKQKQQAQQQQQQQQQQLSPLDPTDQMLAANQLQAGRQHNSPSEFGGSSSGGFTYFSDSSNQGDAFAINTTGHHQQPQSQQAAAQQPTQAQQQQQQQSHSQYLSNGPPDQTGSLMALESPSGGGQHANPNGPPPPQQQSARTQQQYGHQSMKNTPPPPPMYPGGGGPIVGQQQQQQPQPPPHMMMGGHPPPPPGSGPPPQPQMGHPHQHNHLGGQMMQPAHGMGIGGLLGHPQGPSVVQW